eukprot:TRINITY_DN7362_c0_g2_i1.p1 TRINITY_DN7362_c0_g2~~TRINITY_DN7362_c0_g2_i1.p1  ORF type:complete len:112 (-),score=13.58 TRINITY_DN7362_c0_g2_i1:205-540(-)
MQREHDRFRRGEGPRYQSRQGRYRNVQRHRQSHRAQKWADDRAIDKLTERTEPEPSSSKALVETAAQTEALGGDCVRIEQLSQELLKKSQTVRRYLVYLLKNCIENTELPG